MNCKQGDIAVVIHSDTGNEGKLVEVLRPATREECVGLKPPGPRWWVRSLGGPLRVIEVAVHSYHRHERWVQEYAFADSRLRPLPKPDITDQVTATEPVQTTRATEGAQA